MQFNLKTNKLKDMKKNYSFFNEIVDECEIQEYVNNYLDVNNYTDDIPLDSCSLADFYSGADFWDVFNMGKDSNNVSTASEYYVIGIWGVTGYDTFEDYFDSMIDGDQFLDWCLSNGYISQEDIDE